MANTREIEALAAEIGENIYIDVAKWHLYLNDAHLHTLVAERIYPLIEDNRVSEDAVVTLLNNIKVPLGGGKMEVPLGQLLPTKCQLDLMDLLEEFQKNR
ncbi:conserved hypothetical protein [Gloeothece citriformis PCC 7424]|uniref:Thylakoid-associated protein n=1 Tax=Gloeothece citriformis (strain PCC 7424) TaxID=65393 RepID=B7KIN0_GLOC7|nr:DUF3181 family protein [Gloeothece citriformis]ACK69436.1 conserved hypothetical protein [Gloeothece citriformis PCC 7424]